MRNANNKLYGSATHFQWLAFSFTLSLFSHMQWSDLFPFRPLKLHKTMECIIIIIRISINIDRKVPFSIKDKYENCFHQPTFNARIGSSVRNQLLRNSIADNAHTLHLFGFYDKNNDVFEETDTERCGVCENWRTHEQQVSLFFVSPSLHVRQTHIYHNEYATFTPKTRAENAKARARRKITSTFLRVPI